MFTSFSSTFEINTHKLRLGMSICHMIPAHVFKTTEEIHDGSGSKYLL